MKSAPSDAMISSHLVFDVDFCCKACFVSPVLVTIGSYGPSDVSWSGDARRKVLCVDGWIIFSMDRLNADSSSLLVRAECPHGWYLIGERTNTTEIQSRSKNSQSIEILWHKCLGAENWQIQGKVRKRRLGNFAVNVIALELYSVFHIRALFVLQQRPARKLDIRNFAIHCEVVRSKVNLIMKDL